MLMRSDPFRELDRLTQQVFGGNASRTPAAVPMDAYRQGERFVVHFDLPGVDPNSVELTVEKNVLTVKADRKPASGEGAEVLVSERPQGRFTRQLFLGENLDTDAVTADYDRGVLTLTVPVAERAKARRVEIASASGSGGGGGEAKAGGGKAKAGGGKAKAGGGKAKAVEAGSRANA